MKQLKQTVRRLSRVRLRSRTLLYGAVLFGLISAILLTMALVKGDFLSGSSYITGFSVLEVADDGETMRISGKNGKSITLSRAEYGSDSYFRIKKAVAEGGYLRALVHRDSIKEIQFEGDRLYKAEDAAIALTVSEWLLGMSLFFLLACLACALGLSVRKNRRRRRKNKK